MREALVPLTRRRFLRGSAAVAVGAQLAATPTIARGSRRAATLRWFGTNNWEIAVGDRRIVIDPYVTRFPLLVDDAEATPLRVDRAAVDRYLPRADVVLVTQSHFDHLNEAPYLVSRTGARVLGTETTYHLLRALDTDPRRITVVKGGEHLDFGDFSIEVFPSLHGLDAEMHYIAPGTLNARPPRPTTVGEMLEGGTLAFQVTVDDLRIFVLGTANLIERALAGARPDVAVLAAPSNAVVHRYVERVMRALDGPSVVLPTHWDDMVSPLEGPIGDPGALRPFADRVRRVSPGTALVVPEPLRPYRV